jgi:DNA-binding LytR/AlgR family response regulator
MGVDKGNELLVINGENNKVILAIKYPKLVYIKSAGNYLEMFYLKGEKLTKELVRMSFKELEGKINDPNVIRIHRSYMINTIHISSFKKTKKGYALHMQNCTEEVIPVSSGYKEAFEHILDQRMSH